MINSDCILLTKRTQFLFCVSNCQLTHLSQVDLRKRSTLKLLLTKMLHVGLCELSIQLHSTLLGVQVFDGQFAPFSWHLLVDIIRSSDLIVIPTESNGLLEFLTLPIDMRYCLVLSTKVNAIFVPSIEYNSNTSFLMLLQKKKLCLFEKSTHCVFYCRKRSEDMKCVVFEKWVPSISNIRNNTLLPKWIGQICA